MKKNLLLLLAACAFTIGGAAAQTTAGDGMQSQGGGYGRQQGSPDEMAKRQADRMTQELGLSADQSTRVQQIMLARGQEMQAMRGQAGGDRDKMREQMQTSRTKYDGQFKEVLTAEQYTKYSTMQAERMNRGGGRGMEGGGDSGRPVDGASIDKMKAKTDDGDKVKVKGDKVKMKADKKKVKTEN